VKIWRLDGTQLQTLQGHSRLEFYSVRFSPDGQTIASTSSDRAVILWKFNLEDLLVRSYDWLRDYLKSNPNVSESDAYGAAGAGCHLCDHTPAQY